MATERTDQELGPEVDLPEQMRIRRDKRDRLGVAGIEAYPVQVPVTTTIASVRAAYPDLPIDHQTGEVVGIAGRVISNAIPASSALPRCGPVTALKYRQWFHSLGLVKAV